jgi:hypothetical protein
MTELGIRQRWLLREALRRFTRFHQAEGKPLTEAWTGLGTATEYEPVVQAGYMTVATSPNPGYMTWWRLTDKGAEIVQGWLDAGLTHEAIETHQVEVE